MTDTLTTSQAASVAPTEGNMKRSIQMKWFTSDEQKARVAYNFTQTHDVKASSEVIGTVVGEIYSVKRREGVRADGEIFETIMALGDFEAVRYSDGDVGQSPNAYLPKYFLETIEEFEKLGEAAGVWKGMDIALEIVLVPTGKSIPVSYEIRPLLARRPQSAINRMKLALAEAGRLHKALPPPMPIEPLAGEILAIAAPQEGDPKPYEPPATPDTPPVDEPPIEPDETDQGPGPDAPSPVAATKARAKQPA